LLISQAVILIGLNQSPNNRRDTRSIQGKKVKITRPIRHGEIKHQQLREMMNVKGSRMLWVEGDEWPLVAVVAFPEDKAS